MSICSRIWSLRFETRCNPASSPESEVLEAVLRAWLTMASWTSLISRHLVRLRRGALRMPMPANVSMPRTGLSVCVLEMRRPRRPNPGDRPCLFCCSGRGFSGVARRGLRRIIARPYCGSCRDSRPLSVVGDGSVHGRRRLDIHLYVRSFRHCAYTVFYRRRPDRSNRYPGRLAWATTDADTCGFDMEACARR